MISYHVNQIFKNTVTNRLYVIKGSWDEKYPDRDSAFLTRADGTGHAYSGTVIGVVSVWQITEDEFILMSGGHPDWFVLQSKKDLKENLKEQENTMFTRLTSLDVLTKVDNDTTIKDTKVGTIEFVVELSEGGGKNVLVFNTHHKRFSSAELREIADIMDFNEKRQIEEFGDTDNLDEDKDEKFFKKLKEEMKPKKTPYDKIKNCLRKDLISCLILEDPDKDILEFNVDLEEETCDIKLKIHECSKNVYDFGLEEKDEDEDV